jgi:alpha,alpha-trehalose phosphorylase
MRARDARERLRRLADDDWRIVERRLDARRLGAQESVFAVGNGYLGIRGAPEEGTPAHDAGVILNGFHETWPIAYPEDAYGLARTGQTLVDVTDGSLVRLFVDDEPFDLATARVLRYERTLDMQIGVLCRTVEFETLRGRRLRVSSRRLASLEDRHVAALDYEVEALDGPVRLTISSELVTHPPRAGADDPRRGKGFAEPVLVPLAARADGTRAVLHLATRASGLELACGMEHHVGGGTAAISASDDAAAFVVEADVAPDAPLRLSKFLAYHWGAPGDHVARVDRTLDRAARAGYDGIEFDHRRHVEDFWRRSDVRIDGAPDVQQAVRFNLFQLLQATARTEGLGVAAKGVTGRGYEGHYFWDTEIYVVPFLAHTSPDWARQALAFRCGMLDAARTRAREVGHGGALFPWRTISGQEASAWYAAGTAQCHINADIAYAMHQYNRVTGDLDFLLGPGAEVLVETARFWMDLGFFSARRDGRFCINGVTGPDEYTTVVDNNAYTNLMARENLEIAVRVIEWLEGADPGGLAALVRETGLAPEEVDGWRRAAELMYVPRHDELGIVLQDEHFLDRKPWDFAGTPPEHHPLLLHYHPLELYRHQVIKQTDVVLATYLVGHAFSEDEVRRTFDYYDPLTTGDSTLSACVQSIVASSVGYPDAALEYFLDACAVDLLDLHGNAADGIHVASCGGTWLALVAGFGGLRDADGRVRLAPRLPAAWDGLRFRVQVRGQLIEVDMTHAGTTYRLVEGSGILVEHFGEELRLLPGRPVHRAALAALGAAS